MNTLIEKCINDIKAGVKTGLLSDAGTPGFQILDI